MKKNGNRHNDEVLARTIDLCRDRKILIPTFAQLKNPDLIPVNVKQRLKKVGLNEVDPANLFRISWKNEPVGSGGLYGEGNWVEFPPELTGVEARIIGLAGKYFPTGAHKVGAAFGCLVPKLISGEFDPVNNKAVWPSTGNFCRGGAFDSALLGCAAVAILPEEMSKERFAWLESIGAEVIATPGCESNVKEIYDKCWEIRKTRPDCVIFNQFEEFGNSVWHYHVTGSMIEDVFDLVNHDGKNRLAGFVSATGSAGTVAAGDYLRTIYPDIKVAVCEALQCPTLYQFGFGGHRIEGIGDKHIPWIHNVRNTDMVCAIDDEQCLSLLRLFNDPVGRDYLLECGCKDGFVECLPLLGISSICNLVAAIKQAKYYEYDARDVIFTCLTDSAEMYGSRLEEICLEQGIYKRDYAIADFARYISGIATDHVRELNHFDRKALHNFKYFTWVEQQGKTVEELTELWDPDFWSRIFAQAMVWDTQIEEFNRCTKVEELI